MSNTIFSHLSSAKQRINTGKGIIKTKFTPIAKDFKSGSNGEAQQRKFEAGKSYERVDGEWKQTGVNWEEKRWGDTTYNVEMDNTGPEGEKSWLQENSYVDAKAHILGGDIEALKSDGSVYSGEWGSENNQLTFDALGYETGGSANLSFGPDGFSADVSANAEVYLVQAEYKGSYGPAYVGVEGSIGAEISATGEINFNPMNGDVNASVGGEAFAGGKLEGELGLEGQYGKAGGNAGVTYGIGAELNADVGIKDGKISAEFDVGATLGLGVDLGFEVEIDAKETVKDVAGGAKDLAGDGLEVGKKLTGWIPKTPWG